MILPRRPLPRKIGWAYSGECATRSSSVSLMMLAAKIPMKLPKASKA